MPTARFRYVADDEHASTRVLQHARCSNCTALLDQGFAFCPGCGQKASMHRLSLHDIAHEAMHALLHADKGVLSLIKALALRPGVVAREYALEGKRKRYFNPFGFLVLMLGACLTVNAIVRPYTAYAPTVRGDISPELRAIFERQDKLYVFIEGHVNVVTLLALPLIALVFWLFFRRRGVRYAEVLTAQVFFSGFIATVDAFVLTPLVHQFPHYAAYSITRLTLTTLYVAYAYRQLLRLDGLLAFAKTALVAVLAYLSWGVVAGFAGYLYIRYGR